MWPAVPDAPQTGVLYWEQAQEQARLLVLAAPLAASLVSVVPAAAVVVVVVPVVVLVVVVPVAAAVVVVVVVAVAPAAVAVQKQQAQQHQLFEPELAVSEMRPVRHSALAVGYVGYNYCP